MVLYEFHDDPAQRAADAIPMAIIHWRAFRSFTAGLRTEGNVSVDSWEQDIIAWEADTSKPSPYIAPDESESLLGASWFASDISINFGDITIAQVKKKLLKQEGALIGLESFT